MSVIRLMTTTAHSSAKRNSFFIAANHIEIPVLKEVKPLVKNKIQNNYNTVTFQNERFNGFLGTWVLKKILLKGC